MNNARAQEEEFTLRNDPPKVKPQTFVNDSCRQRKLFDGLDSLPGQIDLFPSDDSQQPQSAAETK